MRSVFGGCGLPERVVCGGTGEIAGGRLALPAGVALDGADSADSGAAVGAPAMVVRRHLRPAERSPDPVHRSCAAEGGTNTQEGELKGGRPA